MAVEPRLEVDVALARGERQWTLSLASSAARIGVLGPSGAGKTTLLRVLAGLEPRARGRVVVGGQVLQGDGVWVPPWKRRVGWVPQDATLFPQASVRENLGWAGAPPADVAGMAEALAVGHLLDRRPRHLSGGERQRVALGRALLSAPGLLLLDEPFSALDPELRDDVAAVLRGVLDRGDAALVLVSHDAAALGRLCDETWEARTDGSLRLAGGAASDRGGLG